MKGIPKRVVRTKFDIYVIDNIDTSKKYYMV